MDISPISCLGRLKIFILKNCNKIDMTPMHSMKNLREFHICVCYHMPDLTELLHLYNLNIYTSYH